MVIRLEDDSRSRLRYPHTMVVVPLTMMTTALLVQHSTMVGSVRRRDLERSDNSRWALHLKTVTGRQHPDPKQGEEMRRNASIRIIDSMMVIAASLVLYSI